MGRRDAIAMLFASGAALILGGADALAQRGAARTGVQIACIIRYQIDPFQREGFRQHAQNLISAVPRCGGHLVGVFLPHEGTTDVAWAMVVCDSFASYEAYKVRLMADPDILADAAVMQAKRIILREERNFVELVDGTFNLPDST
jgi:hypothetical protein